MEISSNFLKLHLPKYNLFKDQNPETGRFDVIFEVEGKLIYAHKTMLIFVSDTFDAMLSDRWMENKDEPIKIKDYSYDNFFQFITFLYSAKCQLTETNIFSMVDMAEFYGVPLFKDYCDEYLTLMKITVKNVFQLMDLAEKYSMAQLKSSAHTYICDNFQSFVDSDRFMKFNKSFIEGVIIALKDTVKPEDLFQAVYKWSEKQALNKQEADPNINLQDAIKAEITDFLPHIKFRQMELKFLHEFVVPCGFIFPSLKDLSKILCEREEKLFGTRVKITNQYGQTLHGNLIPDNTVVENMKSLKASTCSFGRNLYCIWNTVFNRPTTPSSLKKREDVKWYLIYDEDGQMNVICSSEIHGGDFLLVELTPGPTSFDTAEGCKIEIE